MLPARPILATLLGRVLQVVQYGILAVAVGIDTTAVKALVALGLSLVSEAVGMPGQLGVSDGVFALSAKVFGTTTAKAMSIALLEHVIQVLFVLLGSLTPLVWKAQVPRPQGLSLRAAKKD